MEPDKPSLSDVVREAANGIGLSAAGLMGASVTALGFYAVFEVDLDTVHYASQAKYITGSLFMKGSMSVVGLCGLAIAYFSLDGALSSYERAWSAIKEYSKK